MRVAYLDPVGGLAGDMLVAGLLGAGADRARLDSLPARLGFERIQVRTETVERGGVRATRIVFEGAEPSGPGESASEPGPRTIAEARELLNHADLAAPVRDRARAVFERLAQAEAEAHGRPAEEVVFHELGAPDTVLDVCGVLELLDDLGIDRVHAGPLPLGSGVVSTDHGPVPVPAPATAILLRGLPVTGASDGELVTPTGAALAAELVEHWGEAPSMTLRATGYGAGTRTLEDRPNVVQILVGDATPDPTEGPVLGEVVLLEANLDDLVPELVPDAAERCFAAGAIDVWTVPAAMKKGRPGIVFSAIVRPGDEAAVARAIAEETSTLGVRVSRLRRYELARDEFKVEVRGHAIRVKRGRWGSRVVNLAPEHDDCAAAARETGLPVKQLRDEALRAVTDPEAP